jgi:hypothetical protein
MLTIVGMPFFAAHPESLQGTLRASNVRQQSTTELDRYFAVRFRLKPQFGSSDFV